VLLRVREGAYRAVNFAMVQAYYEIGRLIVEHEQQGQDRAEYGRALLDDLSRRLTAEFGRGFSPQSLRNMRQFYVVFGKRSALRRESASLEQKCSALRSELTWTHYKLLIRVESAQSRA